MKHIFFTLVIGLILGFNTLDEGNANASSQINLNSTDTLHEDTIIRVEAKPGSGFNFPYYILIPAGTEINTEQYLFVETNNTGPNDTLEFHDSNAKLQAQKYSLGSSLARRLKVPFLVPAFPRPKTNWKFYTHALDRDVVLVKSGDIKRLDLQLIAMIKDASSALKGFTISINNKVLMNGFSASGTFANRFTMVHPEMVAAVASGGINAMLLLPVGSIDNINLDYPVGTHDFEIIFGKKPDFEEYKKVPQFIYMGGQDENDAVLFDDGYSEEERKTIFEVLGKVMMPDRWDKCRSVYEAYGVNATFTLYPHIGHGTDGKINSEITAFFRKHME